MSWMLTTQYHVQSLLFLFNLFPFHISYGGSSDLRRRRNCLRNPLNPFFLRSIMKVTMRSVCFWAFEKESLGSKINSNQPVSIFSLMTNQKYSWTIETTWMKSPEIWDWSSPSVVSAEKESEARYFGLTDHSTTTFVPPLFSKILDHSLVPSFYPLFPSFGLVFFAQMDSDHGDYRKHAKKSAPASLKNHQKSSSDMEVIPSITKFTMKSLLVSSKRFSSPEAEWVQALPHHQTLHSVSYFENKLRTRLKDPSSTQHALLTVVFIRHQFQSHSNQ